MKVTTEKLDNCQVSLNIEAEASELEKSLGEAYHRLLSKISIPGFRKGKAPQAILEQHVGKSALLEEALKRLIPQLYEQAIKSQKIVPIAQPQIEITQNEPLVFKAVVAVKPVVKLGDYGSMRLEPEPVNIGDEQLESVITRLREEQAVLMPVDRPVQPGDFVTISIEASIDGKPFLNHNDLVYEVDGDSTFPLPGFAQQLEGMGKNNDRTFTLEVPADYEIKQFCGRECLFKVKVTEVKEKQLPEIDDQFARSCDSHNLASLKEKVTANLRAEAEHRSRLEFRRKALEAVVNISQVDYPPILEDREISNLLEDEARHLGYQKVEDYLQRTGRTEEELREQLRPIARKRVISTLVLDKIADEEKIEIGPSEVDNKVEEIKGSTENKEEMQRFLALPQVRESIEGSLRSEKTMNRLVQIVSGDTEKTKQHSVVSDQHQTDS
jgi:trigger factor